MEVETYCISYCKDKDNVIVRQMPLNVH